MSVPAGDSGFPHPRQTSGLFGHAAAEAMLLSAYRSGRIAHAWLIGGPPGIGKATLAYRMARFVLAHPDPGLPAVQQAETLAVDPAHSVARKIAAQGEGDVLVLERTVNEQTGRLRTEIPVDAVRRTISFFGSTAAAGGWRVCIVDAAEDLNDSSANALLKVLEEPPPQALFLMVTNTPGRLWSTIRSRSRRLDLRPLSSEDVARAVAAGIGRDAGDADIAAAAGASEGSVAQALTLLDPEAQALRRSVTGLLERLPETDANALHALGESLAGTDPQSLAAFVNLVNAWLSRRLRSGPAEPTRLARIAQAWEAINRSAREVDIYNLDRKALVFTVFGLLADAARGW